jgi:heme exporter protein D
MNKDQLKQAIFRYRYVWAACCLVLIANIVFYVFFVRDERHQLNDLHQQYLNIRAREARLVKKGNGTTAHYIKVKNDLKQFVEMLPPVVTVADKVRELNAVLDKHHFSVNDMTFRPDKTSPFSLWKYATSFTVAGSYPELKNLLADIQNLDGLFCIESLVLNLPKGSTQVDMTLNIATYFR